MAVVKKHRLAKLILRIARQPWAGRFVGFFCQYLSWAIPLPPLMSNKYIAAFMHPEQRYWDHTLVMPKKALADFMDLMTPDNEKYLTALLSFVAEVANKKNMSPEEFYIAIEGGPYQQVMQFYAHVFREKKSFINPFHPDDIIKYVEKEKNFVAFVHPFPRFETHFVIMPIQNLAIKPKYNELEKVVITQCFIFAKQLIEQEELWKRGYTIYVQSKHSIDEDKILIHVTSGRGKLRK